MLESYRMLGAYNVDGFALFLLLFSFLMDSVLFSETMEAPVSVSLGVIRSLPAKIEGLLSPEADHDLHNGEKNKIRLLKDHVHELIDKYLMEPLEVEGAPTSTARCWLKEVRELSYDMDDFLDELVHGLKASAASHKSLRGKIAKVREGRSRSRWVAEETKRFRSRLEEAIQRHKRYNLDKLQSDTNRIDSDEPPIAPLHGMTAARLVGIHSSMEKLEEWLSDGEQGLRVVSIVGIGGIGKTTLARELYSKLRRQFECRAFARSSRKSDVRRLLTSILLQVHRHRLPNDLEMVNPTETIRAYLQHKKYFIIIDDLWDSSTWDIIHRALPDDKCCSRVLTMTEIDIVAQSCCGHNSKYIFYMEPLSHKDSSELFFSRFARNESGNSEEFDKVSSEIVRKCGGFPLATIAAASILARQKEQTEHCIYISKSLSFNLRTNANTEGMKQALDLCYTNLPDRLKACMLYLSVYKEGHIIWKDDLVKQWIAEGFICAKQGKHVDEVAGSYFDELVNGGMIQPVDINYSGEVISCTVHYMVLNLIRYRCIEENFVTAIDDFQTNTRLADKVRRLSLQFGDVHEAESPSKLRLSQVRSLVFFGLFKSLPPMAEFRFLRVLILHLWGDRDNISLDLTTICKFFRLRNLDISCNVTLNLQIQLHGLEYLETLKIDSRVSEIPHDFIFLTSLLHLSLPSDINLPNGIGRMTSLCTLGCFDLSRNSADNVQSLGELKNVRDLHLTCSTIPCDNLEENVGYLASVLSKLSNLRSLNLSPRVSSNANALEASASSNNILFDGLNSVSSTPDLLEKLEFSPRICIFPRLPLWTGELGKLSILKIAVRVLWQSDIDILSRLNALSTLSLYVRTAPAERIVFHKEGFTVLNHFKFICSALCVAFKKEAMPNIRKIMLGFSANALEQYSLVDAGFENLTGLEALAANVGDAGSDESVRNNVQSALEEAFSECGTRPIINVQLVQRTFYGDNEISTDHRDGNEFTRSNVTLPRTEYGLRNDSKPFASNSDTLVRHQLTSLHKDLTVKHTNSHLMDLDTKELFFRSRSQESEIWLLRKKIMDALHRELFLLAEKHNLQRELTDLRMIANKRQEEAISGALKQLSQRKEQKAADEREEEAISDALKQLSQKKTHLQENIKLENELRVEEEELYLFTRSLLMLLAEYNVHPPQINASTIAVGTKRLYQKINQKIGLLNASSNPQCVGRWSGAFASTMADCTQAEIKTLPGIEEFQIIGESRLGSTLTASGYPINGTTHCYFQWVRYREDDTNQFIEGATMYDYLVTADDVGTLLAVHCMPMDDNGVQGHLVREFANNRNKITCDLEMQNEIDSYVSNGRAQFDVFIQLPHPPKEWEVAKLVLGRLNYQIKLKHTGEVVVDEKYSPNLQIKIPHGSTTQCVLRSSWGVNLPLNTQGIMEQNNECNNIRLRDLMVLVMRTFQNKVQTLPSIEGFQIVGEPKLGSKLTACGFPKNGTKNCFFQWVRYLEDDNTCFIGGATMYDYVVTADDVGTYLAVHCTPMDDNGCQGHLMREFANYGNKITCDPKMQNEIDSYVSSGRAEFDVFVQFQHHPKEWEEAATLVLTRPSFQIKLKHTDEVVIDDNYSPNLQIQIPHGQTTRIIIKISEDVNLPMKTQGLMEPNNECYDVRLRDLIVLVMRTFQNKARASSW